MLKLTQGDWAAVLIYLFTDRSSKTHADSDVIIQLVLHPQCNSMTATTPETRFFFKLLLFLHHELPLVDSEKENLKLKLKFVILMGTCHTNTQSHSH